MTLLYFHNDFYLIVILNEGQFGIWLGIENNKNKQNSLFLQQANLEKQQLNLDALLKKESVLCEQFRSKIDEWKRVVTLEHDHREKEYNKTVSLVRKRITHNALQREQSRVQNIVTHAVVADLEKSLSLYFQNSQQSSEYLNSIITFMNERVSWTTNLLLELFQKNMPKPL